MDREEAAGGRHDPGPGLPAREPESRRAGFRHGPRLSFEEWERFHIQGAHRPPEVWEYLEGIRLVLQTYRRVELGRRPPQAYAGVVFDIG